MSILEINTFGAEKKKKTRKITSNLWRHKKNIHFTCQYRQQSIQWHKIWIDKLSKDDKILYT